MGRMLPPQSPIVIQAELQIMDVDGEPFLTETAFLTLRKALLGRRSLLWKAALCGLVSAGVVAFLIPNEYRSRAKLMPPEQQALSSISSLTPLSGQLPVMTGGSLLNAKTPGATSVGILESRTVQDDIINRFDLRRVYHRRFYESTRKLLGKNTRIEENRKDGIIDIDVTDTDRYRARDIARAYIEDLNMLLSRLSSSTARREREFLESRLTGVKESLSSSTRALSQFSSRNATLDYQKQGQATLEVAGKLEEELISAESNLSALKTVYTDDNVQVRTVTAKIGQLREQLEKITGRGENEDTHVLRTGEMFPSIRQLPILGATYADLVRNVTSEETLYVTLQKQYELARVQEAKEIPAVKVLDEPDVAEYKIYPPRASFMILGAFIGFLIASLWIIMGALRKEPLRLSFATPADGTSSMASIPSPVGTSK